MPSCFNPLHCGAVVASQLDQVIVRIDHKFQSPSLRGSGRFERRARDAERRAGRVSIPFIAGQWSLRSLQVAGYKIRAGVSIPFIAGQWSLPAAFHLLTPWGWVFQSPSLRGSGRFKEAHVFPQLPLPFQSPSLRGSGRFSSTA